MIPKNFNIPGIYDFVVIVDKELFEDVRLLQTRLSSLSDTLFHIVEHSYVVNVPIYLYNNSINEYMSDND